MDFEEFTTIMVEILVYETSKEAEQELEKYKRDNEAAFEKLKQNSRKISSLLKSQRYCFVAELAAYVDNKPGKYYYQSVMHPFNEFTELCDNIPSLVEEVKKAIKHQTPYNIGTVLYTVKNHNQENQEARERAEESKEFAKTLPMKLMA